MFGVEAEAESREFVVVRVDGETSFGDRCLVDSHAPRHEQVDVIIAVVLIEICVILVDVDVFNAGVDCDENECEGG